MESKTDVVIVGGGIIGLACAYYLLKQKKSVRIVEQKTIGSGASYGNCGLLHFSGIIPLCSPGVIKDEMLRTFFRSSPLYIKPSLDIKLIQWLIKFASYCNTAHMDSGSKSKYSILKYSLDLFKKLFAEENLDCGLAKKGAMFLYKDRKSFQKYKFTNDFLHKFNLGGKALDIEEAADMEPAIRKENLAGAWYNEHDWHLRPELLTSSLKDLLIDRGLIIEEDCRVTDFTVNHNKIDYINTINGEYKADSFILAAGAWTKENNKLLGFNIPVQPGKGYSITMERPDDSPGIPCFLQERSVVVTPWKTKYRLGGTMEFSGINDTLDKKRLNKLIKGAKEYLNTDTDNITVDEWSGLRPMVYDDLPIVSRSPAQGNLFIATGHGMLGLTMSTGTGKIISDMICGKTPEIEHSDFSMNRF